MTLTREMALFNLLALGLGALLVVGLDGVVTPPTEPARSLTALPTDLDRELPPLGARSPSLLPVRFERRDPFAPLWPAAVIIDPPEPPEPANPLDGKLPTDLTLLPPKPPIVPTPLPRSLRAYTPAQIPIGLAGVLAVPGQPVAAQLTTQDGGQITVQVGSEIPVATENGGALEPVKIVAIDGGDVIVERAGQRVSLQAVLSHK